MNISDAKIAIRALLEDLTGGNRPSRPAVLIGPDLLDGVTDKIMDIIEEVQKEDFINLTDGQEE